MAFTGMDSNGEIDWAVHEAAVWRLESWIRNHVAGVFGRWLRPVRRIEFADLEDRLDAALVRRDVSDDDVDALRNVDLLVRGKDREAPGDDVILAVEVSPRIGVGAVNRAHAGAEVLRRAGYRAAGCVVGYEAHAPARHGALQLGVRLHLQEPKRDALY